MPWATHPLAIALKTLMASREMEVGVVLIELSSKRHLHCPDDRLYPSLAAYSQLKGLQVVGSEGLSEQDFGRQSVKQFSTGYGSNAAIILEQGCEARGAEHARAWASAGTDGGNHGGEEGQEGGRFSSQGQEGDSPA